MLENVKVSGSAWDTNMVAASGVRFVITRCTEFVPRLSLVELHQLELECLGRRGVRDFASPKSIPSYFGNFPIEASGYPSVGPIPHWYCPGHCMVTLQRFRRRIRW